MKIVRPFGLAFFITRRQAREPGFCATKVVRRSAVK